MPDALPHYRIVDKNDEQACACGWVGASYLDHKSEIDEELRIWQMAKVW